MTGGVFALGNFDGVHLGHLTVLEAAVDQSRKMRVDARVLTFEPHPREYFQPFQSPFRLTRDVDKDRLMRKCGITEIVTLPFTAELATLSAHDFVHEVLLKRFQAHHIVAGHDFAFGRGREGNMQKLSQWMSAQNKSVTEISPLHDVNGNVFSSSRIRAFLQAGDTAGAEQILGRPWAISGVVSQGDQRGRTIGVPTANIGLENYLRPKFGVYAVQARKVEGGPVYGGVANVGQRPTVSGTSENLEAHLFEFNETIYGQEWEVSLLEFMRPEHKFPDFAALKDQIQNDILKAKKILNS